MAKLTSDTADKKVGQRIQMRRKELGMTAQQLSEQVDISQQQLSRYERGTNKINVSHLVNIAAGLNTPISWFFIDCQPEFERVVEEHQEYIPIQDADLKRRLEQIWPRLTREQRRVLILFLDEYTQ
ncbi:TPA: helix-turn-helix transcriptional regulator [Citrobacter freundii]|nr:helix-turn-helix transcriptional regulator [Citrobacter farmeri]HAT2285777.1 helix-turn-helix transcriptional regulator [Citrobacter freundii]HAT2349771.1 helix-turn-helix transcriptional regulator [Citrobacter freundii]HAT2431840.1 helix-turn-helix transcriptional regulator [Citrobacter freundii]HAT2500786.1 helix-turn-helix transcriptional regulator [Citrobacter freundii]